VPEKYSVFVVGPYSLPVAVRFFVGDCFLNEVPLQKFLDGTQSYEKDRLFLDSGYLSAWKSTLVLNR
tara:strand:- start:395 stop:595 length:201 start_codon:yes stop_codon:yes gene_type:complete